MPIVEKWVPIAELMLEGKIVPFLGAGASSYHVDPAATDSAARHGPPTGRTLLNIIAAEAELEIKCQYCTEPKHNLAQVASYYARVKHSRRQLDRKIGRLTGDPAYRPNALHRLLARIASQQPMLLITTNYDTLLEDAFDLAGAPYEVVATAADLLAYGGAYQSGVERESSDSESSQVGAEAGMVYHRLGESNEFSAVAPNSILADLKGRSLIYKVHGTVAATGDWRGGYLIAEEDYVRFLGRMDQAHICPFAIRNRLRKTVGKGASKSLLHTLFFLGYSLGDWNLRVLLDGLGVGQGGPDERHYAILKAPDEVAKQLLEKRNIAVHNADLTDLVNELDETLDCLGLAATGAAAAD
jgi:hypothetical protein